MKKFFTKKRIIWGIIILVILGLIIRSRFKTSAPSGIQTDTVKRQNIAETVLSTGQVVSNTDLNLSFLSSGVVARILVKEGDVVKAGQLLATLDQKTAAASLTSALGSLAQAEANYQKVLAGASNEQITVAEKAVAAAETTLQNAKVNLETVKSTQAVLVANAQSAMLNSTIALIPGPNNSSSVNPTINGTYTGTATGQYKISIFSGSSQQYTVSGLGGGSGPIPAFAGASLPIGSGLYVQFPVGTYHSDDYWTVPIPNTQASTYLANYNAYQSALQTQQAAISAAQATVSNAEVALAQAQASLDSQRAEARPADVAVAKAQILSAQGQVAAARATLSNGQILAPASGTITQVDTKVGELATAAKEVIRLENVGDLHAEANVSEANVAVLKVGQSVDYTFDALGPDKHFTGVVESIDPGSTVISGVVNYKVTASLTDIPNIKPGMTANMTIMVEQKSGVLAVPSSAIIHKDGATVARIVTDTKTKAYKETPVTTGLEADGGLVEIISGLSEGQEIVTYVK